VENTSKSSVAAVVFLQRQVVFNPGLCEPATIPSLCSPTLVNSKHRRFFIGFRFLIYNCMKGSPSANHRGAYYLASRLSQLCHNVKARGQAYASLRTCEAGVAISVRLLRLQSVMPRQRYEIAVRLHDKGSSLAMVKLRNYFIYESAFNHLTREILILFRGRNWEASPLTPASLGLTLLCFLM